MFLVPHGAETIVGTTDDDYYGDPSHVDLEITSDEVAYVIEAAARALPQARSWRPLRAWAGVRNTLFEWGVESDDLSRRHEILDHEARDGVPGLMSIVGGKLAAYRQQSEDAVDAVLAKLGRDAAPCTTGSRPLPGAEPAPDFIAMAREIPLPPASLERIWARHGALIRAIFADADADALAPICRSEAITAAEIRHAVEVEGCRTLDDLRRHVHLAAGPCEGSDCVAPAAHLLAELLDWSADHTRAAMREFLNQLWIARRPALQGATLAQEELLRAVLPL
jgi:glycerol-3-phosphate dehydrogenase